VPVGLAPRRQLGDGEVRCRHARHSDLLLLRRRRRRWRRWRRRQLRPRELRRRRRRRQAQARRRCLHPPHAAEPPVSAVDPPRQPRQPHVATPTAARCRIARPPAGCRHRRPVVCPTDRSGGLRPAEVPRLGCLRVHAANYPPRCLHAAPRRSRRSPETWRRKLSRDVFHRSRRRGPAPRRPAPRGRGGGYLHGCLRHHQRALVLP
jgi:hypothetical protein